MIDAHARLRTLFASKRIPHGLLLSGSDVATLRETAMTLASQLLCTADEPQRPCGSCKSCKKIAEGIHPDVLVLRPEKQELTIEQIRELQHWIYLRPYEAPRKVAILDEADGMNRASGNAVLKTLEEPPADATLILTATTPDSLLPTVRSRLTHFRIPAARKQGPANAEESPWMTPLNDLIRSQKRAGAADVFAISETLGRDKEQMHDFFSFVEETLRDQLAAAAKEHQTEESRRIERLFDLAISTEREALGRYGNAPLLIDRLLLSWLSHA